MFRSMYEITGDIKDINTLLVPRNHPSNQMLVHIKPTDVSKLEEIFAILTEDGWHIPAWLVELRKAVS